MTLKIELSGWQGGQGTSKNQLNLSGTPGEWLVSEGQHRARYRFTREFVQGKEVLDAGCGNGYGSVTLLKGGARSVTGLDISEEAIAEAKSRYAAPNLRYLQGDLHKLPFPNNSFDVVVAFDIIEQVPDFEHVLNEFQRVLRPGGLLMVSTRNRVAGQDYEISANPYLQRDFSLDEFQEMLAGYFRLPFDIYGQFEKQQFSAGETFHIPTITESLERDSRQRREQQQIMQLNLSSANFCNSRHPFPNEEDFVFSEKRLDEAPTLIAICRR